MTGKELYEKWQTAGDIEMTADWSPWERLHNYEQSRWDGLAQQIGIP